MEIPNIKIENERVVLEETKVPLMVNGKEEMITLRKLTAGKRRDISKSCIKTGLVGNQMQGSVDVMSLQIAILKEAIVEAPFPLTEKTVEGLPDKVVDYLFGEYEKFTGDAGSKKD